VRGPNDGGQLRVVWSSLTGDLLEGWPQAKDLRVTKRERQDVMTRGREHSTSRATRREPYTLFTSCSNSNPSANLTSFRTTHLVCEKFEFKFIYCPHQSITHFFYIILSLMRACRRDVPRCSVLHILVGTISYLTPWNPEPRCSLWTRRSWPTTLNPAPYT